MMRAREFLTEREGKIGKRRQWSTRGLHRFRDESGRDRFYELHRIMMAVAGSDGISPIKSTEASWVGTYNTAHPYTDIEVDMLKQAYDAIGSDHDDLNSGDIRSEELPDVNIKSPIKPFRGYPR
jgi:hypothetical protein